MGEQKMTFLGEMSFLSGERNKNGIGSGKHALEISFQIKSEMNT